MSLTRAKQRNSIEDRVRRTNRLSPVPIGVSMGGAGSVREKETELCKKDRSSDAVYWLQFFDCDVVPDLNPGSIARVGRKQPRNVEAALKAAIAKVTSISEEQQRLSESVCKSFVLALRVFCWSVTAAAESTDMTSILNLIIDENLVSKFIAGVGKSVLNENVFGVAEAALIHALLWTNNINFFARFREDGRKFEVDSCPDLALVLYACGQIEENKGTGALFLDYSALIAAREKDFATSLSEVNCQPVIRGLSSAVMNESLITFLLLLAANNSSFVPLLKGELSNHVIAGVMNRLMCLAEAEGVSYVHTVGISLLQSLMEDVGVISRLNQTFSGTFESKLQPQPGTYGDVLIEILFQICNNESAVVSLTHIFRSISRRLDNLSVFCSMKIMELVQVLGRQDKSNVVHGEALRVILEGLATMIQKPTCGAGFSLVLTQRTAVFAGLNKSGRELGESLPIIMIFLNVVKQEIIQQKASVVDVREIAETIAGIDIGNLYHRKREFEISHFSFENRLRESWHEWTDRLFAQRMQPEIAKLRNDEKALHKGS